MAFSEKRLLADGLSRITIVADRDPANACPGGVVDVGIYPEWARANLRLTEIDSLFELVDGETSDLLLGKEFPVFAANVNGATVRTRPKPNSWPIRYLSARIRLGYCSALVLSASSAEHHTIRALTKRWHV